MVRKEINGVDVVFYSPWQPRAAHTSLYPVIQALNFRKTKQAFLSQLIKSKRINIIHTYDVASNARELLALKKAYDLNFKIVLRMAGLYWAIQLESGFADPKAIEYIFNHVDVINYLDTAFESLFQEKCQRFGIKVTNPNTVTQDIGIDLNNYQPRTEPPSNQAFTLLSSARFSTYAKRQDLLIEALEILRNENIVIEFAGNGKLLNTFKNEIDKRSLAHKVKFHGHLPMDALRRLTQKADLFVLPSDWEGLNKSVLETMAMKVPVLASDIKPINNYLTHKKTAFLAKNTPEKWAEMILFLKKNPRLLQKTAAYGCQHVRQTYSGEQNIHKYIDTFKQCLNNCMEKKRSMPI